MTAWKVHLFPENIVVLWWSACWTACVSAEPNQGQDEDSLPGERWQVTELLEWNACSPREHGSTWHSRWQPTPNTWPHLDHYSSIPGEELVSSILHAQFLPNVTCDVW